MNRELQFADEFLRHAHPEHKGWALTKNLTLGNTRIDYVCHKDYAYTLVLLCMEGPIVTRAHLDRATKIQELCSAEFGTAKVRVFMLYGELLHQADNLPKGISIMSVTEEVEDDPEERLYDACLN